MRAKPLNLMDWEIPPARQRYPRRDTAFYALSLGLGAKPTDPRHLRLVDPWSPDLVALPSLPLVLGYPGFWLGEPGVREASGVEPWQVLHAEQAVEITATIPADGNVDGRTKVTAILDKGAERGSLLYSKRRIELEGSGALLAVCTQVHYLRKAGGFGSAGSVRDLSAPLPSGEPSFRIDTPTSPQQALMYRLNGDANALHADPKAALRAGFERPILHGMCTVGVGVTAVVEALSDLDPRCVRSFSVRMTSPVLPGETLTQRIRDDGLFETGFSARTGQALGAGRVVFS